MERPNRLIGRLRGGCDLSIQEEFEVYWYIKYLESRVKDLQENFDCLIRATELLGKPFIVAEDKVDEFLNEKTDEKTIEKIYEMADKFERK